MTSSDSPSPALSSNRHALTPVDKQRSQLERLLKDPSKPAFIPPPPKEKAIRPPREMMKNVQGSSAGAGSGEFHVYKASRRREYERLKQLEEESQKEVITAEFERKRKEAEEVANLKTAKNRAKRLKKKAKSKSKSGHAEGSPNAREVAGDVTASDIPIKKRRLVNGKELVFRKPGDSDDEDEEHVYENVLASHSRSTDFDHQLRYESVVPLPVIETPRITIHEDD
ncbi:hypothetical protein BDQ17DRAFT_1343762 [Cyathus striatus]|nr:hypothetical protein BDQ17DRAFT_1343762 [Cyathus striatus]